MKLVGDGFEDCEMVKPPKRKGGFAVLDPAKHRELSSKGGKSAHAKGVAHQFTSEEAKAAGRLGGLAANETKRYKASQHDETKEDWNTGAT